MKISALIARTAYDLTHVNRLRVPEFGIKKLCLAIGDKASKFYQPDDAPPPKEKDKGTDDFHFAPEKEKPKITFVIDDPCGKITKATLELFRRDVTAAIWKKELEAKDYTHNDEDSNKEEDTKHEVEWDGKIDKSTEFPEEYVTVEYSPYKLKLTLEGTGYGYCKVAWTYFHVMVHELKLELGDKEAVAQERDKKLWDALKGTGTVEAAIPSDGGTKEVRLISNLFSTGTDKKDNTAFTQYQTLWADGPNIPVFAKALIKTSDDKGEEVPKALGKVKFLWDYEDEPEDLSMHFDKAKDYIKDSLDRYKSKTKPKGDNCHKDHGGKRGDDAKRIFPAQAGYAPADALTADSFPFKVENCATRKWSSYSYSWPSGILKGKTGVMFQPSRMAGDACKLTVYFPHNRKVDGKDELDSEDDKWLKHAVKKATGVFQIWREVHIIKYLKKSNAIPSITIATVQAYYDKAYIRLEDKSGGIGTIANYDANLRGQLAGKDWYRLLAVEAGDQGAITQTCLKFVSYDNWKAAIKADKGWNDTQLNTWLTTNNFDTVAAYEDLLEAITDAVVPQACDSYLAAADGINILQFKNYWEADGGLESGTNGFASTSFPSGSRNKAAYLQTQTNYGGSHNNMQQTTTHEMGHILFLPHAHDAGGYSEELHDKRSHWNNCTMSYNYDRERKFCGLCLLRLRGWDQTNLDKDRSKNKKT